MTTTTPKQQPHTRVKMYPLTAAIWKNRREDGGHFYSVTFERSYKDKDDQWQSSDSFDAFDCLLLAKLADRAHTEIENLRFVDYSNGQARELRRLAGITDENTYDPEHGLDTYEEEQEKYAQQ